MWTEGCINEQCEQERPLSTERLRRFISASNCNWELVRMKSRRDVFNHVHFRDGRRTDRIEKVCERERERYNRFHLSCANNAIYIYISNLIERKVELQIE